MPKLDKIHTDLLMIKDIAQRILNDIWTFEDSLKLEQKEIPLVSIGPFGIHGDCQRETRTFTEQVEDGFAQELAEEGLGSKTKKTVAQAFYSDIMDAAPMPPKKQFQVKLKIRNIEKGKPSR